MSKNLLTKLLIATAWLIAAVLWLLSLVLPEAFGFFNLNWALVVICGTSGIALILRGILTRKSGVLRNLDLFVGAILLAAAGASVVFALKLPDSYVWPIIAVVITAAGLAGVLITGRGKWDEGDNHKAGYKDYRTRKAEEALKEEESRKAEEESADKDGE